MVHTCHIMADTVFFTTIIDQNSQQLSGIAHSAFVKDGVFEVTAMIPGVVGHSLLKAAMKWQISWGVKTVLGGRGPREVGCSSVLGHGLPVYKPPASRV
jgi:hypothetical protein